MLRGLWIKRAREANEQGKGRKCLMIYEHGKDFDFGMVVTVDACLG